MDCQHNEFSEQSCEATNSIQITKFLVSKQLLEIHSDEKIALETSAFQIFHSGNLTFINWFHKAKFSCISL